MSLNIKNERVHELAREAAERTGRSQTSVIEVALRELLDRLDDRPRTRLESVEAILLDVDRRLAGKDLELLATDNLYDERGLPA